MPLEDNIGSNSTPSDLNKDWPLSTDPKSEGDDHIRNMKTVLQNFYEALNFDTLPTGTVPAIFGGRFDDSKIKLITGGVDVDVPANLRSVYVDDPESNLFAPVIYAPLGLDAPPKFYKTQAESTIVGQPIDSETSTDPIDLVIPLTTAMITNAITIRGAVAVSNVRLTIRKDDANGIILLQTASEEELRAGGGFSILDTGDTVIPLTHYWTAVAGSNVHILAERYDPTVDALVTSGIFLKGATISGTFVPFFNRTGWEYTLVELQEKVGGSPINRVYAEQTDGPLAVLSSTTLHSFTLVGGAGTYEWEITVVAYFVSGNDGYADINMFIDGNPQTVVGHTSLGQVASRSTDRVRSFTFKGSYVKGDAVDRTILITATSGNGVISVYQSRVAFNILG